MRLFIAAVLNPSNQELYERFVQEILRQHSRVLRRVPEGSCHVTLAFLPRVTEQQFADVRDAISQVGRRHRPFVISLAPPQVILAGRNPRLVCAHIGSGDPAVRDLSADVSDAVRQACPDIELTPGGTPHVTLARFHKRAARTDGKEVSATLALHSVSTDDAIEEIQMVESRLTERGPVYAVQARISLTRITLAH